MNDLPAVPGYLPAKPVDDPGAAGPRDSEPSVPAKTTATVASIPRRHDLDALRAVAMLLGILLHGALSFVPMPDAGWSVHDVRQNSAFAVSMSLVHGFRMPLFFLVSGFFTAMLWRKRGLSALLMHRFKRIFLPLAIGMFTIIPAVWFVAIGAGFLGAQSTVKTVDSEFWDAAAEGDIAQLEENLAAGAVIDRRDPKTGMTPLSVAASRGETEAIEQLLADGAQVNSRNRDGSTPLHSAVLFGRKDAAQALVGHGADLAAKDRLGKTPADEVDASWTQTMIMVALSGRQEDANQIIAERKQIATVLASSTEADASSAIPPASPEDDEAESQVAAGPVLGPEVLLLMLVYFPLFHHLWFLWFLCLLVGLFAVYAFVADRFGWKAPSWMVVSPIRYAWLIPLTILPQSMMGLMYPNFGPDTSVGLLPIPSILFYYVIFFFFGAMYFDSDDQNGRLGRWWRWTLPFALLFVFPIGCELSTGEFGFADRWLDLGLHRPLAIVFQVVYVWLMTFGLMGMFRELLSRESKTMRYISDSSYWLYLAHLPLIIVAQVVVRDWQIPAMIKLLLICGATTAILLASYQWCVRYTPIGTLLNGPRKRPKPIVDAVLAETPA